MSELFTDWTLRKFNLKDKLQKSDVVITQVWLRDSCHQGEIDTKEKGLMVNGNQSVSDFYNVMMSTGNPDTNSFYSMNMFLSHYDTVI